MNKTELTRLIVSHSLHQDVHVDLKPLLFALTGLSSFIPVILFHLLLHPVLFRNLNLSLTAVVVEFSVIEHAQCGELIDSSQLERFRQSRVGVKQRVFTWRRGNRKLSYQLSLLFETKSCPTSIIFMLFTCS